jgi:hypothetical protein
MANSVYPPASRELSQKRRPLAPDIEAAFDAFSQRIFADGALPAKTKQVIAVAVAHVTRNARTASRGTPRRRCATVQRQRSSWKQFGSPPRCGLGAPTLIRPFRSWQWTKLLIGPRAAGGRRVGRQQEARDIGNKAAFARAVETGLCAAVSRRWCPRPRRSPLATRPTQVGGGHRSVGQGRGSQHRATPMVRA